ncbi:1-acyl-sn-glycerol-3-phosphate acyltransferase [Verrucomicrobia bacterium S94]|nr:1-acyl-sn-glycerol-3-phosphate acyltransferase [Verrucomicrobia bacterium S94]
MIDSDKQEVMADMRVYQASTRVFKLFLLIWHRLRIRGAENIPDRGGVLLASNHASFLDPPVVGVGYRGRPVHFMARDTLWNSKFGSWWMDHVGCIPVSRGTGDIKALKLTIKALKEGKAVSMFPEGTRTEDGELQEAKGGIGFIIEKSGCVVVPAYIDGTFEAYPKGARFIKPRKLTVTYGKPITQEEFKALGTGRAAYDDYAKLIMQRIADLRDGKDV